MNIDITSFGGQDDYEHLYERVATLSQELDPHPLVVDLGPVSFVPVDGLVALACAARLWHRRTGQKLILCQIDSKVYRYFERMDFFEHCQPYLELKNQPSAFPLFERKPHSERLLELTPIASDEHQNAVDVTAAVERVRHILRNMVYQNARPVSQLCTMLSEIAQNVVHSQDTGYAIVQRYQMNSNPIFSTAHRVIISVADLGIGIEGSLKSSNTFRTPRLACGSDYIVKALELGVTSRQNAGGIGLHQVCTIVKEWEGMLSIRSGGSLVCINGAAVSRHDDLVDIPGTHVTITICS